ncbi:MAG: PKD domain-containing protein [Candidatus Jacksonbacteria bacterium]|nr:PKD domain-containing protein [Candidatus Jacksonbacteria bacterium]MBT7008092.1 PKD domain-containing protein [Candidatus Jacksonbacteria bacterium]
MSVFKKCFLFAFIFVLIMPFPAAVFAQEPVFIDGAEYPENTTVTEEGDIIDEEGEVLGQIILPIEVDAGGTRVELVNSEVYFSAENSTVPVRRENLEYVWDFGDENRAFGKTAAHSYKKTGDYTVTLFINDLDLNTQDTAQVKVSIMEEAIFLIHSDDIPQEELLSFVSFSQKSDFLVYQLVVPNEGSDFVAENNLANQMLERASEIKRSKALIVWTKGTTGINALQRFGQTAKSLGDFSKKGVVIIDESQSNIVALLAQPVYDLLTPQYVLLAPSNLIHQIVRDTKNDAVIENVQRSGEKFRILGIHSRRDVSHLTPWNFLSVFINSLVNRGVSVDTVFLILILPIIATLMAFSRQFIGIKTFGIYIPTILAITLATTGLYEGLITLAVILAVGTVMRIQFKKLRLMYLPRVAIVLTTVSFAALILLFVSTFMPTLNLLVVSIFPILILIVLVEEFVKVQMEEGTKHAFVITLETIAISVVGYYIIEWSFLRDLILSYPEIVLTTIFINVLLGKWHGLRLLEYYRFREVISTLASPKAIPKKEREDREE